MVSFFQQCSSGTLEGFARPVRLKRLIYATNAIKDENRQLRKPTKNRTVFPTDEASFNLLHLAILDITAKTDKKALQLGSDNEQALKKCSLSVREQSPCLTRKMKTLRTTLSEKVKRRFPRALVFFTYQIKTVVYSFQRKKLLKYELLPYINIS